jgi:predicted component of type VI protein secretion system
MRVRIILSIGQHLVREQLIDSAITIVGRDETCDVVVNDGAVSRRHLTIEIADESVHVEDLGSRNGVRVNGHRVARQALRHLDVVEFGDHKMHVFDDALLPEGALAPETTVQGADIFAAAPATLGETQPGTELSPLLSMYGLKRLGDSSTDVVPLVQLSTMVGPAGKSALIIRRRDKLYLTRLSRVPLRVNGREMDMASQAIAAGDVIEVGPAGYELVSLAG